MKPAKILSKERNLHILVDAKNLLQNHIKPESLNFLRYYHWDCFDIKRTPYQTGSPEIDFLTTFQNKIEKSKNIGAIEYSENNFNASLMITNNLTIIEEIGKKIFQKQIIMGDDWGKIWNVFVHASLCQSHNSSIYITNDDIILQNRCWFLKYLPGGPINILTTDEGKEVMDIFAKNLGKYLTSSVSSANSGYYYWISFRSKIPHYNVPTTNAGPLHTFSYRFTYLLRCVDEMGFNYYCGINNDTSDNIQFYFNYFISLVTGIFDSLALETKTKHKISFNGDHIPSKISLNNSSGKDFLKEVKKLNLDLRTHIRSNAEFINLIYGFRELILHGNFKRPTTFGTITTVDDSLTQVNSSVAQWLSHLNDKKSNYDDYSEWGHIKTPIGEFISLFIFSKKLLLHLINFANLYLEKLGYDDWVMKNSNGNIGETILKFQEEKLEL